MASFASSSTTCGVCKHAWAKTTFKGHGHYWSSPNCFMIQDHLGLDEQLVIGHISTYYIIYTFCLMCNTNNIT